MSRIYHACLRYRGRLVWVRCRDGRLYQGRIVRVTPSHVYLIPAARPIAERDREMGGQPFNHALGTKQQARAQEVLFFYPLVIPLAAIISIGLIGAALAYNPWFWW